MCSIIHPFFVMAGLVPAIHAFLFAKTWMPGTRPGMTISHKKSEV